MSFSLHILGSLTIIYSTRLWAWKIWRMLRNLRLRNLNLFSSQQLKTAKRSFRSLKMVITSNRAPCVEKCKTFCQSRRQLLKDLKSSSSHRWRKQLTDLVYNYQLQAQVKFSCLKAICSLNSSYLTTKQWCSKLRLKLKSLSLDNQRKEKIDRSKNSQVNNDFNYLV